TATEAILACDGRGSIAALAYAPARGGIAIPELEIEVRRDAIPVRRGVTRVAPGTPVPAPAPVAILSRTGGFAASVALPGRPRIEPSHLVALGSGAAVEAALNELCDQVGEFAIAVVTDGRVARSVMVNR